MTSYSTTATTTPRATCSIWRAETPNHASDAALTPEGHGVRHYDNGEVIGVTIINARRIVEHDGYLTITLPHSVRVEAGELAGALG
jgi:hypothetical protein